MKRLTLLSGALLALAAASCTALSDTHQAATATATSAASAATPPATRAATAFTSAPATTQAVIYAPATLPGKGVAQHPFFYAGEWDYPKKEQTMFIVREGKVVWSYAIATNDAAKQIQEYSDATLLSNGNVLFGRKTGATLVSPDKKVLWNVDAPTGTEIHAVQPLGTDKVMYVRNGNPAKLFIVNLATGQNEKEVELPTGNPKSTHGQFRRVRITKANTILAAHMDNNKVGEYDMDGKEVWSVAVPSPWAANRLDNGNTLISSNRGWIREYTPKGDIVWEFTQKDAGDIKLFALQECNRLANGNTLITNWCPNAIKDPKQWNTSVQALEVTPDKKVVWALRSWDNPDLGPATCLQLLDEPGVPEKMEQHR